MRRPAVTCAAAALVLTGCGTAGETDGGLRADPAGFDCPIGLEPWGADDAPPIPDLAEQRAAVADLGRLTAADAPYEVAHAEPSALGVVALVQRDVRAARRSLPSLVEGPVLIGRWSPPRPEDGYGLAAQAREVVEARLLPVVTELDEATRGIPGSDESDVGRVVWADAGAVVVQWHEPVPVEVADLAGRRDDGVRVVVEPTAYSRAELAAAGDAVSEHLADGPEVVSATGCADGSGLVVGLAGAVTERDALVRELTEVAEMPVLLEERAQPGSDAG